MTITFAAFLIWSGLCFWLGTTWTGRREGCVTTLLCLTLVAALALAFIVAVVVGLAVGVLA